MSDYHALGGTGETACRAALAAQPLGGGGRTAHCHHDAPKIFCSARRRSVHDKARLVRIDLNGNIRPWSKHGLQSTCRQGRRLSPPLMRPHIRRSRERSSPPAPAASSRFRKSVDCINGTVAPRRYSFHDRVAANSDAAHMRLPQETRNLSVQCSVRTHLDRRPIRQWLDGTSFKTPG